MARSNSSAGVTGTNGDGRVESLGRSRRSFVKSIGAGACAELVTQPLSRSTALAESSTPSHLARFGHTDLLVTRYCQGTAFRQLPRTDNPEARRILHRCLDVGINFFDSAEAYGWGGSERVLGKVIAGRRDKVVVCTKAAPSHPPRRDPNSDKFKLGEKLALTREALVGKCEASLRRLGTDYLDLYMVHSPDEVTPPEEIAAAMAALVQAGKVRYWGISNFKAAQVAKFHKLAASSDKAPIAGTEDYFHIAHRGRMEPELLDLIGRTGMGLVAFSPQHEGQLSPGREENRKFAPIIAALDHVARELGATRPQVCIAWVLTHPQVTSVLGGAESPEHVDDNFPGTRLDLPSDALATLNAAGDVYRQTVAARQTKRREQ